MVISEWKNMDFGMKLDFGFWEVQVRP